MSSQLGFGIGLRPKHFPDFLAQASLPIDWLEIVSENYMGVGGRARLVLEQLRTRFPIATHGVGLSIAGVDPLDQKYLRQLRELIGWLQPSLVTDHLCWTSWQGHHSYDLLPFPLTEESLQHIAGRINYVQEYLGRTLLFENPSCYIDFQTSTYSEPDFLATLCQRTGCGILLDLNNCMVNSRNLNWDPWEYLEKLRSESVGQFHLAGHSVEEFISIDTHDHAVPEAVWQLFEQAAQRFPNASVLLEWDDKIPELSVMLEEIATARQRAAKPGDWDGSSLTPQRQPQTANPPITSLDRIQHDFFSSILSPSENTGWKTTLRETPAGANRGLHVYQSAFPLRIIDVLKNTFPSVHYILEDELMAALAQDYAETQPNQHFSINYVGGQLPAFLRDKASPYNFGVPQSLIAAIAAFDWTHYELLIRPDSTEVPLHQSELAAWTPERWEEQSLKLRSECSLLHLDWPIFDIWTEINQERTPMPPAPGSELCLFKREEGHIHIEVLPQAEDAFWTKLSAGATLATCVEALGGDAESGVQRCLTIFVALAAQGLLTLDSSSGIH